MALEHRIAAPTWASKVHGCLIDQKASLKKFKIQMQRDWGQSCLYRFELWDRLDLDTEDSTAFSELAVWDEWVNKTTLLWRNW